VKIAFDIWWKSVLLAFLWKHRNKYMLATVLPITRSSDAHH
jgi:hypothetical protein